jgi:IS30 family transposase
MLKLGLSFRGCAWNLGYSHTAITNEVNRNGGKKMYNPYNADKRAKRKRYKANQCHRKFWKENKDTQKTIELLSLNWSPTQIVGRWQLEKGIKPFSKTTIYNNVNPDKELCKLLPRKHNKYRRTKAGNDRQKQREEEFRKKSIDARPKNIEKRKTIGHWEADTIIGGEKTARILTHVERKTGYLIADLLKTVSAERIRIKSVESFNTIPKSKRKTFTYDNGREFAEFELIEEQLEIDAYFAHPYHSWERGTNENTNGLIRRYFPKRTLFSNIEETHFKKVIKQINYRPRERLGFRTPHEKFWGVKIRTGM